jgi:hypothetical protein
MDKVEVSDFKSVPFGTQLYRFAHLMQIESLLKALDVFFKHPKASDVFAVFEVYHKFGNQRGLDKCKVVRFFPFYESNFIDWDCAHFTFYILNFEKRVFCKENYRLKI